MTVVRDAPNILLVQRISWVIALPRAGFRGLGVVITVDQTMYSGVDDLSNQLCIRPCINFSTPGVAINFGASLVSKDHCM